MNFLSKSTRTLTAGIILVLGLTALTGCGQQFGTMLYFMGAGGHEKIPAEFTLTTERLAIFVDDPDEVISVPEATTELIDALGRQLHAVEANQKVVPARQVVRKIYSQPDHVNWSIRQIGEKLAAVQVIYIKVRRFALQERAGDQIYQGKWEVAVKVVSTERTADVRLWPKTSQQGKVISAETPIEQSDDPTYGVMLSRKMAQTLASRIALNFYKHTLEQQEEINSQ